MIPPNSIQAFDALCEVQSDKASVEITSPFDGVVKDILVQEGDVAKVGQGLCIIEVDEDEYPSSEEAEKSASPPPHPPQEAAQTPEPPKQPPQQPSKPARKPHPLDPNVPQDAEAIAGTNAENVLATPSVRHFARQKGVDLSKLAPGSGRGGRVEKADIEAYLLGSRQQQAGVQAAPQIEPAHDVVVELGRTRYGMWKAMTKVCP